MHEGKLLVVKHSHGKDFYALPGGHLDHGENPLECTERELVEELGIRPKIGKLIAVHTFLNGEGVQSVEFFFEIINGADYIDHGNVSKTHAHEIDEVRWVSPDESVTILPEKFAQLFKEQNFSNDVIFLQG